MVLRKDKLEDVEDGKPSKIQDEFVAGKAYRGSLLKGDSHAPYFVVYPIPLPARPAARRRVFALSFAGMIAAFAETELNEEDFQALYKEMLAEMELEFVGELLSGTYAIEGDTLFITATTVDEDGLETVETMEFHRIDAASAVVQTTWGGLKAAWRP